MADFKDKLTHLLDGQIPDFVVSDHPKFLEFVKQYYTFMESAELIVTSVQTTDGIQLETETAQENNLLLDGSRLNNERTKLDEGDKIILESSTYGKFTKGEIITGQTSKATSTVLFEDLDNGKLYISAQDKFEINETIVGNSSNASAILNNYKPNPVTNIQELLNFRDPDKAISNFLTKFRNEFLNTLPEALYSEVDRRKLIKNVKSLYRTKGTSKGHQIFFKLLFGLNSETIYPRENILRVSDGKWDTQKILRVIATTGDTADLVGRTITGQTSGATAIIENVYKFQIGENEVSEFLLNEDTLMGTFQISEVIRGTASDEDDTFIKATTTGIPDTITISNDGTLYNEDDITTVTGGGQGAIIQVGAIGSGGLTELIVDEGGTGYEIGDQLVFDNTGTGGNASAKVSVVNGGFTQEDSTSTTDDHIVLEDETTRGDPYTGNKIVQETGTGSGDITDVRIINDGTNYRSLPTITISSSGGSGASIISYGSEIGRILNLKIIESGSQYQLSPTPPTLTLPGYILIKDLSSNFLIGETISGLDSSSTVVTATVTSYNSNTGVLKVSNITGQFAENTTITGGTSTQTATVVKNDLASSSVNINAVVDTAGTFINQDGHISETTMRIQDSLYYQDFSYVIKVGRTINDWRDSFKQTMHTAGFYYTGQVNIETILDNQIRRVIGINSSEEGEPIRAVFNTLFSTIIGRRLGTETDGTTLRSNPYLGEKVVIGDSTSSPFNISERDVTLTQRITLKIQSKQLTTHRDNTTKFGVPVAGPSFKSLNKHLMGGNFSNQIRIEQLADLRLDALKNSSLYGITPNLGDYESLVKLNFTIPSEIGQISGDSFDEDRYSFDSDQITFDVA